MTATNEANTIAGAQRCLFGASAADHCGERASVHVWTDADLWTMSCTQHAAWWHAHPHLDQHPISGACGLPDARWIDSIGDEPGRCEIEGLGSHALAALAEATP